MTEPVQTSLLPDDDEDYITGRDLVAALVGHVKRAADDYIARLILRGGDMEKRIPPRRCGLPIETCPCEECQGDRVARDAYLATFEGIL